MTALNCDDLNLDSTYNIYVPVITKYTDEQLKFISRKRKPRLQKKLHVGDYQETCFKASMNIEYFSEEEFDCFVDNLCVLSESIGLYLLGFWDDDKFEGSFYPMKNNTKVTQLQVESIKVWLTECTMCSNVVVTGAYDCWYAGEE